jgi:SAM-dependent methyltransferase
MTIPNNWYEDFFHGVSLDLWRKAMSPEQTRAEANFLTTVLDCPVESRLFDAPCGNGRLSIELARRGYQLTGIDISTGFLKEARSAAEAAKAKIDFVDCDMRRVEGTAIYDGAFCMGNSFGYMDWPDTQLFLTGVARALKPGARFVVNTGAAAEAILRHYQEREWYQFDDLFFAIRNSYDVDQSCLETEYVFVRDGKIETRHGKQFVYTSGEIRRMLERAGFTVLNMYSSTECDPFELGSHQLFVVAAKA